jgi:ASC-1-like (ASCH) protein
MSEHELQLATEPFDAIASGRKTIESRLFDGKRQAIKLGDSLLFINRENPTLALRVKVIGLLRYESFSSMFDHNESSKFGKKSSELLLKQISEFYSEDEQRQYGVIGIEFKLANME